MSLMHRLVKLWKSSIKFCSSFFQKLENPVLKRDLKVKVRIARLIPALALRFVGLGTLFLLVLLSRLGRGLLALILAEAVLVMLSTPAAVCSIFTSDAGRSDLRNLALTRLNTVSIILGRLAGANLYNCIIILLSTIAAYAASSLYRDFPGNLVRANVAILILMFASTVISLAFSALFRRRLLASAMLSYIFVLILVSSVIIPGPLIERMPRSKASDLITWLALHANPLIMTSRALGRTDIMRTRYMYNLADPIVSRGFSYPNWYSSGILYFGTSCLLLVLSSIGFWLARRPSENVVDTPSIP